MHNPAEIVIVRHAPARHGGRLCGRTDVACDLPDAATLVRIADMAGPFDTLWTSPALRCRMTADALVPACAARSETLSDPGPDPRLWEQDFGEWEGRAFADLPDLGPLTGAALADHAPPGGESFRAMCVRVQPALLDIAAEGGRSLVVAHAGTVRAALALALGAIAPALRFDVAPLSATLLRRHPGGEWSIGHVNRCAEP